MIRELFMGNNSFLIGGSSRVPSVPSGLFISSLRTNFSRIHSYIGEIRDHFLRETFPNGKIHALLAVATAHPAAAPIFLAKGLAALTASTPGFAAGTMAMNPQTRADSLKKAIEQGDEDALIILMQQIGRGNVYAVHAVCDLISGSAKLAPQALEELASVDLASLKAMATDWSLTLPVNRQAIAALRRLNQTVDIDEIKGSVGSYDLILNFRILNGNAKEQDRGRKLFHADLKAIEFMTEQAAGPGPDAYKAWKYLMQALKEALLKKSQQGNITVIDTICSSIQTKTLVRLLEFVKNVEDPDALVTIEVAGFFEMLIDKNHHKVAAEILRTWQGHPRADHLQRQLGLIAPTRVTQTMPTAAVQLPRTQTPRGIGGRSVRPSTLTIPRLHSDGSVTEPLQQSLPPASSQEE
jgi:hypothetical protein